MTKLSWYMRQFWFDDKEIGIWRHSIKKLLIQVCFWRRRWSGAIGWLESTSMPKVRKVPSKNRSSKNIWPADRQINIARGTEWMGTKCKISQNTWSKITTVNKDVGRFDAKLRRESVQYREESFFERNVIKLPPWIQSVLANELGKGKRQRVYQVCWAYFGFYFKLKAPLHIALSTALILFFFEIHKDFHVGDNEDDVWESH